jgi:8-oxo-dGTP pyrophosphatase MutT (NUDIX family)
LESKKKDILEKYLAGKEIEDHEWNWLEKIDWHPVDELEFHAKFRENLDSAMKSGSRKIRGLHEL